MIRILLVVALLAQGWEAFTLTRYDTAFRNGMRAYYGGNVDDVIGWFEKALEIRDTDPFLWAWLGDSSLLVFDWHDGTDVDPAWREGLLDKAWRAYAASVARCPSYSWSWSGLANTALHRTNLDISREGFDLSQLRKVDSGVWDPMRSLALSAGAIGVGLKPSGFQELDLLADIHMSAGDHERARDLYLHSAGIMPAPSFHGWGSGRRFYGTLYREILDAVEKGIAKAPTFEWSMLHLEAGRFAFNQLDYKRAEKHFRHAEVFAHNEYEVYRATWEQSTVYLQAGRFQEAVDALKRLMKTPYVTEATHRRLASLWSLLGEYEESCRTYKIILHPRETDSDLRIQASKTCEEAGDIPAAINALKGGFVLPTDDLELSRSLVELYERNGFNNTKANLLREWQRDYPEQEEFFLWSENTDTP